MVQNDVFNPCENLFEKISKVAQIFIYFSCRFVISKVWSLTRVLNPVEVVSKFLKHRISPCALMNIQNDVFVFSRSEPPKPGLKRFRTFETRFQALSYLQNLVSSPSEPPKRCFSPSAPPKSGFKPFRTFKTMFSGLPNLQNQVSSPPEPSKRCIQSFRTSTSGFKPLWTFKTMFFSPSEPPKPGSKRFRTSKTRFQALPNIQN